MKIKLLREVLVGPADVIPTRGGTVVDLDDAEAKQFIDGGLAEMHGTKAVESKAKVADKKAPEPRNKMKAPAKNKARR